MSSETTEPAPAQQTPVMKNFSLHIGNLPPDIGKDRVLSLVEEYHPIKVYVYSQKNGHPRAYAFVQFGSSDDAERALRELENFTIEGNPCRVAWSKKDPTHDESTEGNLFVRLTGEGPGQTYGEELLKEAFGQFGLIKSCKIVEGRRRYPYGYVLFEEDESAQNAIAAANGEKDMTITTPDGGTFVVSVERYLPRAQRFRKIFVSGIAPEMTEEEFRDTFARFGPITKATLPIANGKNRGFGFIDFQNCSDAIEAVKAPHGTQHDDPTLLVERARAKGQRKGKKPQPKNKKGKPQKPKRVYVGNLGPEVDKETLREGFAGFGNIIGDIKVEPDKVGGDAKAHCFVQYSSPQEAARAIAEMNGKMIGSMTLIVAYPTPRWRRKPHKSQDPQSAPQGHAKEQEAEPERLSSEEDSEEESEEEEDE